MSAKNGPSGFFACSGSFHMLSIIFRRLVWVVASSRVNSVVRMYYMHSHRKLFGLTMEDIGWGAPLKGRALFRASQYAFATSSLCSSPGRGQYGLPALSTSRPNV